MNKNIFAFSGIPVFLLAMAALPGCDQKPKEPASVEVLQSGSSAVDAQPVVAAISATESVSEEPSVAAPDTPVEDGQYRLLMESGRVTLLAKAASRLTILEDMAEQGDFKIMDIDRQDKLVTVDFSDASIPLVLDQLLGSSPYTTVYQAATRDNGFRIVALTLGAGVTAEGIHANAQAVAVNTGIPSLPVAEGEIYFGQDEDEIELAQRLQFGAAEDRAIAVSEIMMDPTGFNAAYLVFRRDPDPQVRLAVLELIEAEDNFLARQMIVTSLQDPDRDVAMYALEIIDSLGDFSLVPQVESLYTHPDAEISAYAREVRENLTSAYFLPDEELQ